jgi:hypothetical protein
MAGIHGLNSRDSPESIRYVTNAGSEPVVMMGNAFMNRKSTSAIYRQGEMSKEPSVSLILAAANGHVILNMIRIELMVLLGLIPVFVATPRLDSRLVVELPVSIMNNILTVFPVARVILLELYYLLMGRGLGC